MLELIKQRLKSKTYIVAIVGAGITALEANSGFITSHIPGGFGGYLLLVWPALMLTLREVTTVALSDK